jgi:hypothetical protein
MTKYVLVLFFCLSAGSKCFSQSDMSDYSFVIVPERFDFLNEDDKYQLNSIAEFLFNKHGFHAFKSSNAPNAKRCDGLYAEVVNVNAMLRTKLELVLRDCNDFEVYRSPEGVTRLKKFKQAHQDALRKAFAYFDGMEVNQKEIEYFDEVVEASITDREIPMIPKISDTELPLAVTNLPKARFSSYKSGEGAYMLRKTETGYALFKESAEAQDGLLMIGKIELTGDASRLQFIAADKTILNASFDVSENLTIQKEGGSVTYNRVR